MKKHIKLLTCLVIIALLISGCTLNDGEKMKTKTGQEMFFFWNQRVEMLFSGILERAFNFNAWLTAPESEKQEVLNRYFDTDESDCTFYEIAPNIWRFQYNGDEKQLLFELSGGNSLNDPDAVLTVRLLSQKSNNPFVNCVIIIQNVSAGVWKIQTNGGENVVSGTLRVGDSAPASLMSSQDLAFKAEGMFTFFDNKDGQKVPVYMLSTINSPMIYTFRGRPASWWHESSTAPCTIKAGEVTLTATDRNGEGNTAVITVTGENTFNVAIGGVTQPWHL